MKAVPLFLLIVLSLGSHLGFAESAAFQPRELFRIPFGTSRETLGAKIEGANFLIPRDFTMDSAGHFYLYDSIKHRIVRTSSTGAYEMSYRYPATAEQIFAHADSRQNLWLLISDPVRGVYYGVYDPNGKALRQGVFSKFHRFRLHVDDEGILHILLSPGKNEKATQTYIFHEESLLLKKEDIAPPREDHHRIRQNDRTFYIDPVPGGTQGTTQPVSRVTDEARRNVAEIKGSVVYVTGNGDIYTRLGERELRIYDIQGKQKGALQLQGLPFACAAIRFDSEGHIYELDGIPDASGEYTPAMPGMRLIKWERR